jgi:hypothetical protein
MKYKKQFSVCSVLGFAIIGSYLQYMNIKVTVVYKITNDLCGKCVGTLFEHIFQFFLTTFCS